MKDKMIRWALVGLIVLATGVNLYWLTQAAQAWVPSRPKVAKLNDDRLLYVEPGSELIFRFEKPIELGKGAAFYRAIKKPWTVTINGQEMTVDELLRSERFKNASPEDRAQLLALVEEGRQYERERAKRQALLGGEGEARKFFEAVDPASNDSFADSWWDLSGHSVKQLTDQTLQIVVNLSPGEISFIRYHSPERRETVTIGLVGAGNPDMDAAVQLEPLPASGEVPSRGSVRVFLQGWKAP